MFMAENPAHILHTFFHWISGMSLSFVILNEDSEHFSDCGGTITTPKIINPIMDNDPESDGYMSCVWVAKAPAKKSVVLRFEEFNISQPLGR